MISKRKLEKRKKREKIGRERSKKSKMELLNKKVAENNERKRLIRLEKLQKDLISMNQPADTEKLLMLNDNSISQLEKNITILKGLEQEYENEQKKREVINEELEEQGYVTLDQKLKVLQEKTATEQKANAQVGITGSAECSMQVNK